MKKWKTNKQTKKHSRYAFRTSKWLLQDKDRFIDEILYVVERANKCNKRRLQLPRYTEDTGILNFKFTFKIFCCSTYLYAQPSRHHSALYRFCFIFHRYFLLNTLYCNRSKFVKKPICCMILNKNLPRKTQELMHFRYIAALINYFLFLIKTVSFYLKSRAKMPQWMINTSCIFVDLF